MPTSHISASDDAFAETCRLPGDPLRAKWNAETFLDDARDGLEGDLVFDWGDDQMSSGAERLRRFRASVYDEITHDNTKSWFALAADVVETPPASIVDVTIEGDPFWELLLLGVLGTSEMLGESWIIIESPGHQAFHPATGWLRGMNVAPARPDVMFREP